MTIYESCGIPEMTFEEEASLPENMQETKNNKLIIMSCCSSLSRSLEQIKFRAKCAPMKNDDKHAELMREFARLVKEAEKAMWDAAKYRIS